MYIYVKIDSFELKFNHCLCLAITKSSDGHLLMDTNFKEYGVVPQIVFLLQMLVRNEYVLALFVRVLAGLGNDRFCSVVGLSKIQRK